VSRHAAVRDGRPAEVTSTASSAEDALGRLVDTLGPAIAEAYLTSRPWPARVREALRVLLAGFEAHKDLARTCLQGGTAMVLAAPRVAECRRRFDRDGRLLERDPPQLSAELLWSGAAAVLAARLADPQRFELMPLLDDLAEILTAPYAGGPAVRAARDPRRPAEPPTGSRSLARVAADLAAQSWPVASATRRLSS
jgi:hypothetical protein